LKASIFKSDLGDLYLFAHNITMEPYERLVVRDGSFIAVADGAAAGDGLTVSSIAASNYLVLVAPTALANGVFTPGINIRSRAPASVVSSGNTQGSDRGTELVAGAVYFFSSTPNTGLTLGTVVPSRTSYAPSGSSSTFDYQHITGNLQSSFGPETIKILSDSSGLHDVFVADLVVSNSFRPILPNLVYLDLTPTAGKGPFIPSDTIIGTIDLTPLPTVVTTDAAPRTVLQQSFTPNVPRQDITATPPEVNLAPAVREQLQALGIYARALLEAERRSRLHHRGLFITIPERERARESDYEVAEARVEDRAVRDVLRLATAAGLIGEDQHKLDDVAKALATSFDAFSAVSASGEAADFRAWLQNSKQPEAVQVLAYVKTLSATLKGIELLGLTRVELDSSKAQIYGSILRARLNVEPEFFRTLVEGVPAATRVSAAGGGVFPVGAPVAGLPQ